MKYMCGGNEDSCFNVLLMTKSENGCEGGKIPLHIQFPGGVQFEDVFGEKEVTELTSNLVDPREPDTVLEIAMLPGITGTCQCGNAP